MILRGLGIIVGIGFIISFGFSWYDGFTSAQWSISAIFMGIVFLLHGLTGSKKLNKIYGGNSGNDEGEIAAESEDGDT
ncbi:MAG: hypothetical protein GKR91_08605 [Pseudomonadales bacterium]|nr:hypothetical protein [Pseudomonadales bacterium]